MTFSSMRGPRALRLFMLATAMLGLLVAGCSDDSSVGNEDLLKGTGGSGGTRLGETTTTVAPETTAPPAATPGEKTTTTKAAPAPPPTRAAAPPYEIKIQPDQAGTQFEPRVAQVFAGTSVKWINTDSQPRSVEFSDQSYQSGPIAPGQSATFTANRAGEFNYSDGTRPYAVGTLRVQAR